ncbi:40S ribosomal protein S4, partial [Galemys pyrenaicus]
MDVTSIDKTGENFHLICDVKGHFAAHRITLVEAKYKLCKTKHHGFLFSEEKVSYSLLLKRETGG